MVLPLIAAMIWGSSFVIGVSARGISDASASTRCVPFCGIGAAVAAACCAAHSPAREVYRGGKALLRGGLICGFFLTLGVNLQQFGSETTTAGKAGFITTLYIILVPVFSIMLGKKAKKSTWIYVLFAVAGLYFLCFDGGSVSFSSGDFYIFLCAFAFTAQILAVDHYVQRVDGIALSCAQFVVVIVLSAVGALVFGEHTTLESVKTCIPYLLYVGVVSSGVGYTLQILAQKDGDPTVVSLLLSLESFFAVVCGAIVLHERMSLREYFGCALMLAAVILSQLPEKSAKEVESGKKE